MRNRMYGGVRGRKTKVGEKLLRFPPTRLSNLFPSFFAVSMEFLISRYNILLTVGEANEQIPHPALKSGMGDLACSAELFHLNGLFRSRILSIYNFVWVYQ